jgi:hypothetical protein
MLKMADQQTVNGTHQAQLTNANHALNQSITVQDPSQIVQAQIDHTASIQFQASFAGGPTIQHQQTQHTSLQYQVGIKQVAPSSQLR